jgi:hypothetical protein
LASLNGPDIRSRAIKGCGLPPTASRAAKVKAFEYSVWVGVLLRGTNVGDNASDARRLLARSSQTP